jgi:hypothetical protein
MSDIETLTDEERRMVGVQGAAAVKALRIIDAQAERIDRARKILAEGLPVDSPESRLASDLREVLGD